MMSEVLAARFGLQYIKVSCCFRSISLLHIFSYKQMASVTTSRHLVEWRFLP